MTAGAATAGPKQRDEELRTRSSRLLALEAVPERDRAVAELDPLGADGFFRDSFVDLNRAGKADRLLDVAGELASQVEVTRISSLRAMAALRDIGFVVAAAARHGADATAVPGVEATLCALGAHCEEVPRDQVYSYASRNPRGMRRRSFTHLPEEELFISRVTDALDQFPACIEQLTRAVRDRGPVETCAALGAADAALAVIVESLLAVKRHVTPEVFSFALRPYFPDLLLGGRRYFGPGGAQMPLMVIDVMLAGSAVVLRDDGIGVTFRDYVVENSQYLSPEYRDFLTWWPCSEPLADRLLVRTEHWRTADRVAALSGLERIASRILQFRRPHRRLAEDNMNVRPPDSKGSGGYSTAILDVQVAFTEQVRAHIRDAVEVAQR